MRLQLLLSLVSFIGLTWAFKLQNGAITSQGVESQFSTVEQIRSPIVFNDTDSELSIRFELDTTKQPDQIFIKLSNANGVEASFKPNTRYLGEVFVNKLSLPYSKLPKLFTHEPELDISLVIADFDESLPKINTKIGSIKFTESLIALSKYVKPTRFEHKPEIHHIFQQPAKTVNSFIALVFSGLSVAVLFSLILVWISLGVVDFKNFPGLDISAIAFIGLIFSYEVVFFQYYLGSTIFQTIFKSFVLLSPTVWFGSKVLNYAGSLRLAGKR